MGGRAVLTVVPRRGTAEEEGVMVSCVAGLALS